MAYGLRNPFRLAMRPGTNEVWIGDAGWNSWEEIDRPPDPGGTAENFGWPCYEGAAPARQAGGYDGANLNLCENLYAPGEPNVVRPYFAYSHTAKVVAGESCPTGSSSIRASLLRAGGFPDSYDGALFFADYSRDCIWAMPAGGGRPPEPLAGPDLRPGRRNPSDLEIFPAGSSSTDFDGGQIRRIVHTAGNQPPIAGAAATPPTAPRRSTWR